LVKFFFF